MKDKEYTSIEVESFIPEKSGGSRNKVRIRPLPNQLPFEPGMKVSCSNHLKSDYPVGTIFKLMAILKHPKNGDATSVFSPYTWEYEVIKLGTIPNPTKK